MNNNISIAIISSELLLCIFFAAFTRIQTSDLAYSSNFLNALLFIFGFALLNASRQKLSLTSLGTVLVVLCLTFQWNIFWVTFFNSCFTSFSTQFTISVKVLIQNLFCSLCLILTLTDTIGKYSNLQMLAVCLIETIGFSLNSAAINYGFKTVDGGAGLQVFLMSAALTFGKWLIYLRPRNLLVDSPKITNPNRTISMIGLVLVLFAWPGFNMCGSLFTQANTINTVEEIQSSAFITTIMTLCSSICFAFTLLANHFKIDSSHYINAVLSGGIIMASSADVVLDPVAGIVLGGGASLATIMLHKTLDQKVSLMKILPQPLLRLMFSFMGGIFASILVIGRTGRTPTLSNNLSNQAIFVLVSTPISLVIGVVFGCASGFALRYIPAPREEQLDNDLMNWEVSEEIMPIYPHNQAKQDLLDSARGNTNKRLVTKLVPDVAYMSINNMLTAKKTINSVNSESDRFRHTQVAMDNNSVHEPSIDSKTDSIKPIVALIQDSVVNKTDNYRSSRKPQEVMNNQFGEENVTIEKPAMVPK